MLTGNLLKNCMAIVCFLIFCNFTALSAAHAKDESLNINARAAILMDAATGQVYYAKGAELRRSPASLTKLMTAILAVENGKMDDIVTVTERAASVSVGSTIGLNKGDRITLENLLKSALITSANDSTVAIAEHVGGNHDSFIYQMNRKAVILGAADTRFTNTNGYYEPQHYTTAYDLGLITRYALQKPYVNKLVATRETVIRWVEPEKEKEVHNTNRLLRANEVQGIDGVKTGSTARAGNCLIASATRGDKRLIAVVLHAGNRYREAAKLLEYGFSEVRPVTIFPAGKEMTEIPVKDGIFATVPLTVAEPVRVEIARDQQLNIKLNLSLNSNTIAPVREGQRLGHAVFTIDGYQLLKVPLVAAREVPPVALLDRVLYWFSK
ncbi:D-alanyl-D-alanine carboxypeptidase DacF precursor [Sporotomaculum syntrophicum]|uniref:serine-type D-Ala-D-Ala carboxypeptidase n=1 Tax=Sporotomaculum syntrophicum TaxID=182264 RepID=A0A9D2WQV0_9FIRM|nr:D-alanyl-D-alanine carboxypeptidase family protein [Sporotomaculum syntrophicum]KAF1085688.1 D-alanyl-D-alanine carboxypeptidase DacF precursor [Sporotomaculum syntrophicum]